MARLGKSGAAIVAITATVVAANALAADRHMAAAASNPGEGLALNFSGSVDGLVHAIPSRDGGSVRVRLSLHGLKPGQTYGVKASRHACHGVSASHFEGWTDGIIWTVVARTKPTADDLYKGRRSEVVRPGQLGQARALYVYELADGDTASPVSCGVFLPFEL